MESVAKIRKQVCVDAIVYPACICGKPLNLHLLDGCNGYIPSRPIENLGTIAFQSPDIVATVYWKLEKLFRNLRQNRIRRA